jgi:hypothetical protein
MTSGGWYHTAMHNCESVSSRPFPGTSVAHRCSSPGVQPVEIACPPEDWLIGRHERCAQLPRRRHDDPIRGVVAETVEVDSVYTDIAREGDFSDAKREHLITPASGRRAEANPAFLGVDRGFPEGDGETASSLRARARSAA